MTRPAVVAVDMDGTFLRPDMTYDRERFAAVKARLDALGVRFVVASGNQHAQLASFFEGVADVSYVAENGHVVVDSADGVLRPQVRLDPALVRRVVSALDEHGCEYVLSGADSAWIRADSSTEHVRFARTYYHRLQLVDDPAGVDDQLLKLGVSTMQPDRVAEMLRPLVGDELELVVSGVDSLDLNAPGTNKATGLQTLLAGWGRTLDEVVAFGDSGNDVEMLTRAGHAVAMPHARPEVLALADEVAPSPDGVLAVLEQVFA